MKLKEIHQLAIEMGRDADPRGEQEIQKELRRQKRIYDGLKGREKEAFPTELLENPYADSRVVNGDGETEIKGLLCGVDMETQEILLADRLREKGLPIDMVLTHHPEGTGLVGLADIMEMQSQIFAGEGIPIHIAEGVMAPRIEEIRRRLMASNFQRAVDAARLLNMPLMSSHTPCDNLVQRFLDEYFAKEQPETVGDVIELLYEIPEYRMAAANMDCPVVLSGKRENSCGRILCEMTGGTGTAKEMYKELSARGFGTCVCMHMRDEAREEAEKYHINVVIAGHMASDSIGINLLLDALKKRGVEIYAASGLLRVER
ncbi:MAG: NGG1p interacting factor NIF3 [Bacillota bacterium]